MLRSLLTARFARKLIYLLSTLMVLGGQPLMALPEHVQIVPREDQPGWLEPWLEAATYTHAWDATAAWARGTSTELQDRLDTWWDGAWEPVWEHLEGQWALPAGPKRIAVVHSDTSKPVPAFSAAVGSAGSSDSLAKPQVPGFEKEHSRSEHASDRASAMPLQRVERKARRQEGRASDLGLKTAGPAQPSIPRQAISKAGLAPEIVALAASLNNSPGRIFRYVHDEVDFEPLWGAGQPPLGTLQEGAGTPWDKAWLLRDLLTAAGVDARFEWGEIEISGEQLVNLTGVEDPFRAGDLLSTAGVPIVLIVSGSQVVAARMSHVWIKAYLDYVPNRGATPGSGDTWVAIDPSLERFEVDGGTRLDDEVLFELAEYLPSGSLQAPREAYEAALDAYVTSHGLGLGGIDELKPPKALIQEAFPYVPGTLRGRLLSVAGESVEMPASFEQQVQLQVRKATGEVLLSWSTSWPAVYGQRLELAWPGASSSDQATLDLYGGVFSTPPYEVDLRPVLRVDGAEVASGSPIGSAEDVELVATLTPPQGALTVAQFELYAGEHAVFAVDFGRTPQQVVDRFAEGQSSASDPGEAEGWGLARAAAVYLRGLAGDLDHLAALRFQRVVKLGNIVLAVQRGGVSSAADGTPLTFSIAPPSIDLGAMTLGLFAADGVQSTSTASVSTLELLGSQASAREAEALTTALGGAHVSAVTFLTRAAREGQQLTLVDAANVDDALEAAELSTDAEAAVRAGVSQGLVAWIPESQLVVDTWDATGYILEQPATGAAGYFVTYERLAPSLEGAITFHAPQDLDVITQPTDVIASINVPDLASWTLSTRPTGQTNSKVIASGTGPVDNTLLGQFDPTLLLNGMHDLVLTGSDPAGQTISSRISVVVEGNMKIGHFTLSFVDLAIPLSGLDIEIVRTYDSRRKDELLDFGYGWSLDIRQGSYQNNRPPGDGWQIVNPGGPFGLPCSSTIESKSHLTTVRLSDQEVYRFRLALVDAATVIGGCYARAEFQWVDGPLPGTTLEILGNDEVVYQGDSNGDFVIDSDTFETFVPDEVKLTTRDGRIFHLSLSTGVTHLEDLNGNAVEISVDGITHSSGVGIDFVRDGEGRIQEIVDLRGKSNLYNYSAAGDLVRHTDRAGGETQFAYREHYLEDIHNALGVRAVRTEYDDAGRLVRHIDAEGNVIELRHDLDQRQEVVTNRLGQSRLLEYDGRGNVVREVDESGAVTERTFDNDDNLLTEKDPLGRTTTYTYTAENDLASTATALGETTAFTYNGQGQILTLTDPGGHVTTSTYDASGNLLSTTDALGHTTTFSYDAAGNLLGTTGAVGHTTEMTYNARGDVVTETDALGHATSYTYDGAGNRLNESRTRMLLNGSTQTLTTSFEYDELDRVVATTAADGTVTRSIYDALGRVTSWTDQLGRVTTMDYNPLGQLVTTTYPGGTSQSQSYDAEGRALTRTDRASRVTQMAYDAVGRLVTTTYPDGATQSQSYDAASQLLSTTDARGNTTTYAYDAAGRRTQVTDALDQTTSFGYDARGNQTSMTDARGHTTEFAYDALGRLSTTTYPDATTTQVGYDALGRRVSATDQAGITTEFEYDALGRLTSVTDALDQVTSYTYDELGNRLTQTDANDHTTSFEFDQLGRQIAKILPDDARESMTYNADGTLASHTDFNGDTRTFEYDENRRLVRRAYPGGTEHLFSYTATGQRETATDARGVTSYAYDARDRLLEKQDPNGHKLTYTYDLQGNRETLTATVDTESYTTSYGYDALNRQVTVTDPQGWVNTLSYDSNGNRASLTQANGLVTSYGYDPLNRLELLETVDPSANVIQSYGYTLEPTGHRSQIDEADGTTRAYEYDDLYRLTQDRVTDSAGDLVYQQDFVYDPVGNRLSQTIDEGAGASIINSTFDDRDRLLTGGSTSYGWNTNGNLTARGADIFEWDLDQRLTSATLEDGTVVATVYDVDGNRVQTEVSPASGPADTVNYLVDARGLLSHVVADIKSGSSIETLYIRSDNEPISLHRPGMDESKYYLSDGVASIRHLTAFTTSTTDSYDFTAFGELVAHTGNDEQSYRFAGEPAQAELGLSYHRARWANYSTGSFVSMDPFGGVKTDPMTLHRYLYAGNDPANTMDPSGLFGVSAATVIGGLTVLAIGIGLTTLILGSGKPKALVTHAARFRRVVIVNGTWDEATVLFHLVTVRSMFQKFGVALSWGAIEHGSIGTQDIAEWGESEFQMVEQKFSIRDAAVLTFIGSPLTLEPYGEVNGRTVHNFASHRYISAVPAGVSPRWTGHEVAHLLAELASHAYLPGNLMSPTFGTNLDDRQLRRMGEELAKLRFR